MVCDPKKIFSDLNVVGKVDVGTTLKVNSTSDFVGNVLCEGDLTVDGTITNDGIVNLENWVPGQDYSIFDERAFDSKLYVCLQRVNDGRTTTPLVDTEFWRQAGYLTLLPDVPAATTENVYYRLFREGASQETGVTVAFGANPTTAFDSSYVGGFPANISNFNNGRVIEFANGLANAPHVSGNLSIGNVGGVRVSIASGNDNDTLVMKVAEMVGILNASVNMNLRFAVNLAVNTSMDIFFIDTSIDIDPANIVVRTTSGTGIVLGNDFSVSINVSAPSIILVAPNPTWEVDPTLTVFDIVDWTTLVLAPTTGDQTGIIGTTGDQWTRQCTYRGVTYFRVVSVATPLTKDGWYIDTTTSEIGTAVPNAQRI